MLVMYFFAFTAILACFSVLWFDITSFTIPNEISIFLIISFIVVSLLGYPIKTLSSLEAFSITFLITGFLWYFRIWGGGDFKLMSSLSLWTGLENLFDFAMLTLIIGGIFAFFLIIARRINILAQIGTLEWRTKLERHMPYGVAISIAGIIMIINCLHVNS